MIPETSYYKLDFSELTIDKEEFTKLLGYSDYGMPEHVKDILGEIFSEAHNHLDIR